MPPSNVQIPATCRGMGDHIYVYVADDAWDSGMVTQEMVDNVVHAWEVGTEKHPDLGIYEHTTSVFGEPPDVDDDPHIIIFITPLGQYNGTTFDGYFKSENETPGQYSNMTEMVYIDCEHHRPDSEYLLGVLAHEFQHMLQWRADRNELSWLNETLSQASMYINGYWGDLQLGEMYLHNTAVNKLELTANDQPYDYNYGAGFLFAAYCVDRFGEDFFHDVAMSQEKGRVSINEVLAARGDFEGDFYDLILDWAVANMLNDSSLENGIYAYAEITLNTQPSMRDVTLGETYTPNLVLGGYYYYRVSDVTADGDVKITLEDSSYYRVKAIVRENGVTSVVPVDVNSGSGTVDVSSDGSEVIFIIERVGGPDGQATVTFDTAY